MTAVAEVKAPARPMGDVAEIGGLPLPGLCAVAVVLAIDPKPSGSLSFLGTAFGFVLRNAVSLYCGFSGRAASQKIPLGPTMVSLDPRRASGKARQ